MPYSEFCRCGKEIFPWLMYASSVLTMGRVSFFVFLGSEGLKAISKDEAMYLRSEMPRVYIVRTKRKYYVEETAAVTERLDRRRENEST